MSEKQSAWTRICPKTACMRCVWAEKDGFCTPCEIEHKPQAPLQAEQGIDWFANCTFGARETGVYLLAVALFLLFQGFFVWVMP